MTFRGLCVVIGCWWLSEGYGGYLGVVGGCQRIVGVLSGCFGWFSWDLLGCC